VSAEPASNGSSFATQSGRNAWSADSIATGQMMPIAIAEVGEFRINPIPRPNRPAIARYSTEPAIARATSSSSRGLRGNPFTSSTIKHAIAVRIMMTKPAPTPTSDVRIVLAPTRSRRSGAAPAVGMIERLLISDVWMCMPITTNTSAAIETPDDTVLMRLRMDVSGSTSPTARSNAHSENATKSPLSRSAIPSRVHDERSDANLIHSAFTRFFTTPPLGRCRSIDTPGCPP